MKSDSADKLTVLRANDHFRHWHTLDDERVCVLCDRRFTGHDIVISTVGGEVELHCPNPNCSSGAHQWVYPGNPLISQNSYQDWWHALGSTPDLDTAGGEPSPQPI